MSLDLGEKAGAAPSSKSGATFLAVAVGLVAMGTVLLGLGFAHHARTLVLISLFSIGSAIAALALFLGSSGLKGGSTTQMPVYGSLGSPVRSHPRSARTTTITKPNAADGRQSSSISSGTSTGTQNGTGPSGLNGTFTYYGPEGEVCRTVAGPKCDRSPITASPGIVAQFTALPATDHWSKPGIIRQFTATADVYTVIPVSPANGVKMGHGSNNRYPAWDLRLPDCLVDATATQPQVQGACVDLRATTTKVEQHLIR